MKKKVLSVIIAFAMTLGLAVFMPKENGILDTETVSAASRMTLEQLQAKFPTGKHWNHLVTADSNNGDNLLARGDNSYGDSLTDHPCATHSGSASVGQYDCNCFDGGIQCCGFARKLAYDAFGSYASGWGRGSVGGIKAGDVIHYYGNDADVNWGHWVFVATSNGDSVTVGECNSASDPCVIKWGRSIPKSWFNSAEIYSAPSELTLSEPADPLPAVSSINTGVTRIKNVGTGLMMNYGHGSADDAMFGSPADGTPEQNFRIVSIGGNAYKIEILHSNGGIVNFGVADGTSIGAGVKLSRWSTYTGDSTQQFYFRSVGNNKYVITSTKGDGVIATTSSSEARLYTQGYHKGDANQQWELLDITSKPADSLPSPVSVRESVYNIRNVGRNMMMNYGHGSADDAMFGSPADGTPEQKFRVVSLGSNKYKIEILHSNGGIVNFGVADGTTIGAGVKMSRWSTYSGDTTQQFYFRKVGTNQYVITSTKGDGVIADDSDIEARLYTQNYSAGNKDQIWELIDLEPALAVTTTVTTTPKVTTTTTTTVNIKNESFIRGIDVSGFQKEIDWTAVKKSGQAEFAIIRAGTTLNNDTETFYNDARFEENYSGAKNAGIKIGLYYYCGATTKEGFVNCANDMIEYLNGKTAEYPVYIDVEASQTQMNMGKATLTEYLISALDIIKNAGYKAGVYASQSWFTSYIDKAALQSAGYEIWQARWPSATSAVDPLGYDESANCGIWQYSSKGSISGINGNVDVDVSYIDYSRTAAPEPFKPNGDINRDDAVDEVDIFLLNNHLTGKKISDKYRKNTDINGDGKINVIDLILLKRLMANK